MIHIHFINVGQGNMVAGLFADGSVLFYDCNITEENKDEVFQYLKEIMPKSSINVFVNSHRDADHMRGIKKLNKIYKINTLWDSGVSGNTDTPEYEEYMDFRANIVPHVYEIKPKEHWTGKPYIKILNGKRDKGDINSQSIVLHIDNAGSSALLTGDTDAVAWKNFILPESGNSAQCSILLASHHGSITFFDDPSDEKNYYTEHIRKMNPAMTIISVGDNIHGHPDTKAIELYEKHSRGSNKGNKVFRTDKNGNMRLDLKDDGNWTLYQNQ